MCSCPSRQPDPQSINACCAADLLSLVSLVLREGCSLDFIRYSCQQEKCRWYHVCIMRTFDNYKGSAWAPAFAVAQLQVGQGGTRTRKRGKSCSCLIRHYWKFKVMPRVLYEYEVLRIINWHFIAPILWVRKGSTRRNRL